MSGSFALKSVRFSLLLHLLWASVPSFVRWDNGTCLVAGEDCSNMIVHTEEELLHAVKTSVFIPPDVAVTQAPPWGRRPQTEMLPPKSHSVLTGPSAERLPGP